MPNFCISKMYFCPQKWNFAQPRNSAAPNGRFITMTYSDFAQDAIDKLKDLQESFKAQYDIDRYAHWFYTQSTELLRLYDNDTDQLYLKYIPVGTYSEKEKTWMWSWANKHSREQSKNETLSIKEFGEKEGFDKLSEGYFSGDEYDGWEFIAIAHHLLGGIGGYRTKSDGLCKYFLIVSEVDPEEAKKMDEKLIECGVHGRLRHAFICQHLTRKKVTGFEESFPTYIGMPLGEDDDFMAWCDECEKVRVRCDGWAEEAMKFANMKVVCEECYFDIKEVNTSQRLPN